MPVNRTVRASTPVAPMPEDQREVADQTVVGAEDRRPEGAGQLLAAAGRQPPQHLTVDPLVRGHGRAGVVVVLVRRPALGPLHQGEHEDGAEVLGEEDEQPGPDAAPPRRAGVVAQQVQPVRLVPLLRVGQGQQDLPLLPGPALAQLAVTGGLGPLVRQILPPPADLAVAPGRSRRGRHAFIVATRCSSGWPDGRGPGPSGIQAVTVKVPSVRRTSSRPPTVRTLSSRPTRPDPPDRPAAVGSGRKGVSHGDDHLAGVPVAAEVHGHRSPRCVLRGVGERLLDDAMGRPGRRRRQDRGLSGHGDPHPGRLGPLDQSGQGLVRRDRRDGVRLLPEHADHVMEPAGRLRCRRAQLGRRPPRGRAGRRVDLDRSGPQGDQPEIVSHRVVDVTGDPRPLAHPSALAGQVAFLLHPVGQLPPGADELVALPEVTADQPGQQHDQHGRGPRPLARHPGRVRQDRRGGQGGGTDPEHQQHAGAAASGHAGRTETPARAGPPAGSRSTGRG